MKTKFRTESGSLYEIDYVNRTWARLQHNEAVSPFVRTPDGTFDNVPEIVVGRPVIITGPSLTPGGLFRIIQTTPVTEILQ
jgi:hypothetical protein